MLALGLLMLLILQMFTKFSTLTSNQVYSFLLTVATFRNISKSLSGNQASRQICFHKFIQFQHQLLSSYSTFKCIYGNNPSSITCVEHQKITKKNFNPIYYFKFCSSRRKTLNKSEARKKNFSNNCIKLSIGAYMRSKKNLSKRHHSIGQCLASIENDYTTAICRYYMKESIRVIRH